MRKHKFIRERQHSNSRGPIFGISILIVLPPWIASNRLSDNPNQTEPKIHCSISKGAYWRFRNILWRKDLSKYIPFFSFITLWEYILNEVLINKRTAKVQRNYRRWDHERHIKKS